MKVLYHIDMESDHKIKYHFKERIMGFSPVIKNYIYAVTKDGALW